MNITPLKINTMLFFKVPAAFWCGVRASSIVPGSCSVTVKHRWINQNPFRSIYFAVQAMAAELSTGALVLYHIKKSGEDISMLVARSKSTFTKKARGRITFSCADGMLVAEALSKAKETLEGQTFWMKSTGVDEQGDKVSVMEFEWTVKIRSNLLNSPFHQL
ncbi:thioesterase [Flavobacterium cyanobacteriorum]|uniref:Thioesterase n=1 Tax=Flavobacterium cyanobacteriorum TaxID=2022802 RepID=A0A255Z9J7_9FLAO|nr:DUF4442 domain-containing protein [Flavobacterium cyanobacteriorum]OYQ38116.1 thioesterase [Flavobacterium cyanobacteriorum]